MNPMAAFLLVVMIFAAGATAGWHYGHRDGVADERRRQAAWRASLERRR